MSSGCYGHVAATRAALAGPLALVMALVSASGTADAKLPGAVHCYNDICHRVRTVAETEGRRGVVEAVVASFYDTPENDRFNPRLETSSGTAFEPDAPDNAASPIHPDGTVLLLWSPVTRGAAVVRINNAGPYYPGRTLDVSRGVAERLGFTRGGVMQLLTVVIAAPSEPEAHYARGRTYPKVRGYLGTFENLALASLAEPVAREALFRGDAPLPALALSTSQQLALTAAEQHFRRTELMLASLAVPAHLMPPPVPPTDLLDAAYGAGAGLMVKPYEVLGDSLADGTAAMTLPDAEPEPTRFGSVVLASLAAPALVAWEPARGPRRAAEPGIAATRVRQHRAASVGSGESGPPGAPDSTRGWFDADGSAGR